MRKLVALCVLVLALVAASPAFAREHARLVVRDGSISARYPPIVGVYPAHGAADRSRCTTVAGCDVIPLTIESPGQTSTADVLVTFTLRWDPDDGNVINAALFSDDVRPRDDVGLPDDDAGRNDAPGLVKWTSGGGDGSLVLRAANLSSGGYALTVTNSTGANNGFSMLAQLARVARSSDVGPAGPEGSRPGGDAPAEPLGAGAPNGAGAAAGSAARDTDARYDGAVGMPAAIAGDTSALGGVSGALAVAAVVLLAVVAIAWWRASRASGGAWFRDLRLFWKLMAPFVVVILVVGVAGTFLTGRYLAERADTELTRRLAQSNAAATGYLRDQEFTLLDATRFAANVEGLPEAVSRSDAASAERALASVAAVNDEVDVIAALAPDGRSLATLTRAAGVITPHAGERWSDAPPVRSVLDGEVDAAGDKHAGLLRLVDGSAVLVVAAPVRANDALVGAVVVGRRAGKIVDEAARRSGATVAIYDGSAARIASSDTSAADRVRPVARGESRRERDDAGVGRMVTGLDVRDRRVATLAVAVPLGSAFDAMRQTAVRLAILVALGLAAIVAIGALLSRNILQTVRSLLATNRALGRGELGARAPVLGKDELGELAQGVNQMADQLEASYQQLERRVAERTEELQRLYRAREEFFASVSHELRTPLFAIIANSELLVDPVLAPNDPKEQAAFLGTINLSAQQLVANVNDILDLARADAAAVRLKLSEIDLDAVLDEVTASIQALGRRVDVAVARHSSGRLPPVTADRERLVQIMLNLGSNAVKYTPAGGRVTISAVTADDTVEISVADTGPGIAAGDGERIFEPYYIVAGAGQHGDPSTGLGLAVAKRLVDAHGGSIGFTSSPAGTTFTVTLPLRVPQRSSTE